MNKNAKMAENARFSKNLGGESYEDFRIALKYFDKFQTTVSEALQNYIKKYCKDLSDITVLEIGTGTGVTTLYILAGDPRITVVSVDSEPKMLQVAKRRIGGIKEYQGRITFILSDALHYLESCKDNSFDAFVSVLTLHNLKSDVRKRVLALIARKIKPGGIFINGDKYVPNKAYRKTYLRNEIKDFDSFDIEVRKAEKEGDMKRANHLRRIKKEWTNHALEDDKNHITIEEQNKIFEKLGFSKVQWIKEYELVAIVTAMKKGDTNKK